MEIRITTPALEGDNYLVYVNGEYVASKTGKDELLEYLKELLREH